MKKLKNLVLAGAMATTLSACGGGGGSGSGPINDFVQDDLSNLTGSGNIVNGYASLLSDFNSTISGGDFSKISGIITGPDENDIAMANTLIGQLDTAVELWEATENLIANQSDADKYKIYNSQSYKNAYASLLYLKNHVKPIIQKVANGRTITLEDYNLIDKENKAQQIIDQEKDTNANDWVETKKRKKAENVVVDTPVETIINGTASISYTDWTTVYQGGGQETRTKTTTTPRSKRTVTTRCVTPRVTYLNGSYVDGASSCSELSNVVEDLSATTVEVAETREGSNPVVSEELLEADISTATEKSAEYTITTYTDASETTTETSEGSATTTTTNRDVTASSNNGTNTWTYTTTRYIDTTVTTPITTSVYRTRHFKDIVKQDSRVVTTTTQRKKVTYKDGTTEIVNGTSTVNNSDWTTVQISESKRSKNILQSATTADQIVTTPDSGSVLRTWTSDMAYTNTDVFLGDKTENHHTNSSTYETNEYLFKDSNGNKQGWNELTQIKASSAYAKGWTGKGSTVAIADTGYDVDHTEFTGKISAIKDYTNTGVNDNHGHGTHVIGTVIAKKDNVGMHGVAFDSKAVVIKIGDGDYVSLNAAADGFVWAADQGAVVGNLSANSKYDHVFRRNDKIIQLSDGTYKSTDARYDYANKKFYNNQTHHMWKNATDKGMVIVNSAGNQGFQIAAHPGYFATVTDANGNLELGGKMLIVGAVDHNNNMTSYSNQAGHLCVNVVDNKCNDKYKVSDFYVLAPGSSYSTKNDGGYGNMSGTSMAAPFVTGQVAILHQMWPHMPGESLVKLVTQTADKNINGYNVNIHGQGIIDLDEATKPQGAVGIPTTGRTDGATTNINGSYISGSSSAIISNLSDISIMVLDDFDRDYYVSLGNSAVVQDKRKISDIDAMMNGYYYMPINNMFGSFAQGGQYDIGYMNFGLFTGENGNGDYSANIGKTFWLGNNFGIRTNVGQMNEVNTWLGNNSDGVLAVGKDNTTNFGQVGISYQLGNNVLSIDYSKGFTDINTTDGSLISGFDTIESESYKLAYEIHKDKHNTFGWSFSLPSHITSGSMDLEVAESVNLDGTINYTSINSDLTQKNKEKNIGFFYNHTPTNDLDASWNLSAEYRQDIAGEKGKDGVNLGINYVKKFSLACGILWMKNPKCYNEDGSKKDMKKLLNVESNNAYKHGLVYDMKTDMFVPIKK
jgi:subtilisin family serine protease